MKKLFLISLLSSLLACNEHSEEMPSKGQIEVNDFELLTSDKTGLAFVNRLKEGERMNGLFYEYFYNGGGVSIGDVNNDGLQDIYFTSNLESNRLYLNKGNLQFEDITKQARVGGKYGFSTGTTMVDINQDGLMDIYVCKSGQFKDPDKRRNELHVNQGLKENGLPYFKESAKEYGLDIPTFSTQVAFFDFDLDNDLDMFLINHGIKSFEGNRIGEMANEVATMRGERLYENRNGYYYDITEKTQIINNNLGYCLGIGIGDFNNDHWPDVYVGVDYGGKDHLYLNNQDGTFKESILSTTDHISNFSMGNDIADFNNDGWDDFITVDMASESNYDIKTSMGGMNPEKFEELVTLGQHHQYMFNALQLNRGVATDGIPTFSEMAQLAGVASTDWSWAPLIFDMDNDGRKDIFISNGIKRDFRNSDFINYRKQKDEEVKDIIKNKKHWDIKAYVKDLLDKMPERKRPNYFYKNSGDLRFEKIQINGKNEISNSSTGAAYADFDNDGDLDIVVNNVDAPALIYKNNRSEKGPSNYISIGLKGPKGNLNGIGTAVLLTIKDQLQKVTMYPTRGFQSSVSPILHFGLGISQLIDEVKVIWPDGSIQIVKNIATNQQVSLNYSDAEIIKHDQEKKQSIFVDVTSEAGINHRHQENKYDDFEKEVLLPHKMSQFGPALAVGDVNGDGLDDFFVGGAKGKMGSLYLQKPNATFKISNQNTWKKNIESEDVDALFFDADNDGDMDLYVVSGGNEYEPNSKQLADRLYINNGMGIFDQSQALPKIHSSGSKVKAQDFDQDGDQDLFVGGRLIPGKYPSPASSQLLRNDTSDGDIKFNDVTEAFAPSLLNVGMVTDAVWADFNGDAQLDLAITGEWMTIRILVNMDGKFQDETADFQLNDQVGWWYSLEASDFDGDGDIDIVGGNLGLNYKYQATAKEPFEVFASDFDHNGAMDIVLGYQNEGELFPLRGRSCSSEQIPNIKEKYPTYNLFAQASLEEVYGTAALENALHYEAKNFSTSYFQNQKGQSFEVSPLPEMAQISLVNSIVKVDVDNDTNEDLILAGNLFVSEVETTRSDAGKGLLLRGDGSGNFHPVPALESGLIIDGDVRQMLPIKLGKTQKYGLIIVKNNDFVQLVALRKKELNKNSR